MTECPLCETKFEPTQNDLMEAGWHEGANPERVSHAIQCSPCQAKAEELRREIAAEEAEYRKLDWQER